jgi:hypothetical protein
MNRWTFPVVLIFIFAAIAWLLLSGSTRTTYWPNLNEIVLDPQNLSEALIPLEGRLEGLERIDLLLPFSINRRPIRILLTNDQGEELAELEADPETRLRTNRFYALHEPLPAVADQRIVVRLLFEDGPILKKGLNKKRTLKGLGLTLNYPLDASQTLMNYIHFKPIPSPALFTAVLFVLYASAAAFLWGLFTRDPSRPAQPAPKNEKPEEEGPPRSDSPTHSG